MYFLLDYLLPITDADMDFDEYRQRGTIFQHLTACHYYLNYYVGCKSAGGNAPCKQRRSPMPSVWGDANAQTCSVTLKKPISRRFGIRKVQHPPHFFHRMIKYGGELDRPEQGDSCRIDGFSYIVCYVYIMVTLWPHKSADKIQYGKKKMGY